MAELVVTCESYERREAADFLAAFFAADAPRVRRLKSPHAIHPVYMRASRNPKIVELLTDLWGSLRFDTSKLNMKSAG